MAVRAQAMRLADGLRSPLPVAAVLATAAVYYAAAKLGLAMAFVADQVSVVWPPSGIALAAVILLGPRVWPGIALGAFLANATADEPLFTAAAIAAGCTLEAAVAGWLLRRVRFQATLDRLRHVIALVVVAAASTTMSATAGVLSLCLGGVQPWTAFSALWSVWWIGDSMGALIVAPLLLVWTRPRRGGLQPRRLAEAAALVAALLVVNLSVFAGLLGLPVSSYPLHYTIFPFVVWAALRFGQRGTTAATFCASAVAIWSTVNGWGPFGGGTANESLVLLQLFLAVVAVTGLLLGAVIAERDVAERRRAIDYARLQVSEKRLRLALTSGRMRVWEWDVATGALRWSASPADAPGPPAPDVPQTYDGMLAVIHADDRAVVGRAITGALGGDTDYEVEFRYLWPDGRIRWTAAKGTVVRDEAGRPLQMIGVSLDVTERRRLEEELRARAAELAEADRRKDEFLAMLGHELRNPLAALSTALHLLGRDMGDRERYLGMAGRQVKQLVRLVEDLLDVSRITQGRVTLRKEVVDLADAVARAVETVPQLAEPRAHRFSVTLPEEPVYLSGDPARLAQILANLLSNAAKYTPTGGSIALSAERVGGDVLIRVRDTGAGLAPELRARIFDLFVQADTSLDRTRGGLGIGLTVVRHLVELHGGEVEARSGGVGQGSELIVRLPVLAAPGADLPRARPGEPGVPLERGLKVLVVEDNQDAAEGLAMVITGWGHDVRIAFDGTEALDIARRYRPDVVVSDIGLPHMDGYALARRLREHVELGRATLIALSGYGRDEDKRLAREAGFDHHLVKPPNLETLGALLSAIALEQAAPGQRAAP